MNDLNRRVIGYTVGGLVLSSLCYGGFMYQADADAMTLLGSVEVHLKLAGSMPETGATGEPNPERQKLLDQAQGFLARAREQDPALFLGLEYEAWLSALRGDYRAAAGFYQQAQRGERATAETRESDLLNESRMWRRAGEPKQALAALARRPAPFSSKHAEASQIQEMLGLDEVGQAEQALKIATAVVDASKASLPLLDAGHLLARHGRVALAEKAYVKAAYEDSFANYFLARLKIKAREFDSGLNLLEREIVANGSRVRAMLRCDHESWRELHDNERFKSFLSPGNKAAVPGR